MSGTTSKSVADLTLERVNRLNATMLDMMESHAAMGRQLIAAMDRLGQRQAAVEQRLTSLEGAVHSLGQELVLLGNRVETALSRAARVDLRLDDLEDQGRGEGLGQ